MYIFSFRYMSGEVVWLETLHLALFWELLAPQVWLNVKQTIGSTRESSVRVTVGYSGKGQRSFKVSLLNTGKRESFFIKNVAKHKHEVASLFRCVWC